MKKQLLIGLSLFSLLFVNQTIAAKKPKKVVLAQDIPFLEVSFHEKINLIRQQHGLCLLKLRPQISDLAKEHSYQMSIGTYQIGHDGSDLRFTKMQKIGRFHLFAENVSYNYGYIDPVDISVNGLMEAKDIGKIYSEILMKPELAS